MPAHERVKGPASCFSSIKVKYGKSIAHWMHVREQAAPLRHMALVSQLKTKHPPGHGHAGTLAAWLLACKPQQP
ncbi:DUF4287 domain-containing protein [Hydrogenophaga palleronii]|uniref:DUF4287 domain-containing protein n=1 Tax=Hydrogenophaga palleronii TaxID=65655 RepID=UPI000826F5A6|nr:DUF4287 domain-containing protein [Hydrogenophaga palleronii]